MRDTQTQYEINGRKFAVKKMNALLAIGVLRDILTTSLPINLAGMIPGFSSSFIPGADKIKPQVMSIEEFAELQKTILKNAYELLPAGETCVIGANGNFGVEGVEFDLGLVTELLGRVLEINYVDFFTESLSKLGLLDKLPTLDLK